MEHNLIDTLVVGIVLSFIFGCVAQKFKLPTIIGYLVAGIFVGPYTPGFTGDINVATQFAEIGIILLMFGVGLHFSFDDLYRVKNIAVPGALFQMFIATLVGCLFILYIGFNLTNAVIFGFSLSIASTIVLIRTLEQRNAIKTKSGKIAIGWLIVEDIAIVLLLVLLPILSGFLTGDTAASTDILISKTLGALFKITGFMVLMIIVGKKFLPKFLIQIDKLKSNELSSLSILAIALGFAYLAYTVFSASFALGSFFAGLILSESEIGRKNAEQTLPMRDAFAVLFFVSVGMLFNPMTIIDNFVWVLMTLAIIIIGKSIAAIIVTTSLRQTKEVSFTIACSLAQVGEFSFILAGIALKMNILDATLYNIILASSLLSIALNPFVFKLLDKFVISE